MADIVSNLVAHYVLDDNAASTTVVATVGSNGTLVGGDDTEDLAVGAGNGPGGLLLNAGFLLDGINDYITAVQGFSPADPWSFSIWEKSVGATQSGVPAMLAGNSGNWELGIGSSIYRAVLGGFSTGVNYAQANYDVVDGTWHHLCFTSPGGSATHVDFYDNGEFVGTLEYSGATTTAHTSINIGRRWTTSDEFEGTLSDAFLFSRDLAAADILALKQRAHPQNSIAPTASGTTTVGSTSDLDNAGTWSDGSTAEYRIITTSDVAGEEDETTKATDEGFEWTASEVGLYGWLELDRANDIGTTTVRVALGLVLAAGGTMTKPIVDAIITPIISRIT